MRRRCPIRIRRVPPAINQFCDSHAEKSRELPVLVVEAEEHRSIDVHCQSVCGGGRGLGMIVLSACALCGRLQHAGEQDPHTTGRITCRTRSANDDAAGEDRRMVLMVVIVTGAGDRQWQRSACSDPGRGIPPRQSHDNQAFAGSGPPCDVVRLHVVVDERDPLADRDDQLPRVGAGR